MAKKKIGRKQDAEIKKQLRIFAKKEFNEKKPLEIRVLQLKPGVIFKKGTMLPNLIIKTLAQTAYIIYLDYGDQLKFYYFAKNGMSMGGSNFDKNEKLLKEMHGKATTILKLPKSVQITGFENENREIRKYWKKLADRYSRKFTVNRKKLPAVSVKKNFPIDSIRIGIREDKDIFYFNYDYFNTELQNIILLRELFPIFSKLPSKNDTVQIISTLWALTLADSDKYIQILKKIQVKRKIVMKTIHWIEEIFIPLIKSNPALKKDIAQLFLRSFAITNKDDLVVFHDFFNLFLLWFMESGIKICSQFFNSEWKFWLFFEMLEFFYTKKKLCQEYEIIIHDDKFLPLFHLLSQNILGKESKIEIKSMNTVFPNYCEMQNALENIQLSEFLSYIPESIIHEDKYFIKYALFTLFSEKGIIVESENIINMAKNSEKIVEISIKNITDWKLENVTFRWDFIQEKGITVQILLPEKDTSFDDTLKLKAVLKSTSKVGKNKINIFMYFKNPIDSNIIESMLIKIIEIEIQ